MTYQVALLNFEGPLDLLLQLIERSDLEITQIPLADVTSQYLDYIGQLPLLNPTELNQFLELASRLIYLKSLALLPVQAEVENDEDLTDLAEQLEQYRHYQKATRYLEQLLKGHERSWTRETSPVLPPDKLPLPTITLPHLEKAFNDAVASLPKIETTREPMEAVSLEEMTNRIQDWLEQSEEAIALEQLFARMQTRTELVVAFIALLELTRLQTISVSQGQQFGAIIISRNKQGSE